LNLFADVIDKIGASVPLTGKFADPREKHLECYQMCIENVNDNGGWILKDVIFSDK
jgi:ABC-type branched-subunit amino acid transport system substrate-binding protein